jgi:hypothetical protein
MVFVRICFVVLDLFFVWKKTGWGSWIYLTKKNKCLFPSGLNL